MSDPLRVVVVGCGGIARQVYLPLLDASEQAEVTALVDVDASARERMAERYPRAAVHTSAEELDPHEHDCALVLTPIKEGVDGHYEPVLALMEGRLPTLCEKPLSAYLERAEEMVEAAEGANTLLMMSVNRRFTPVYVRAREFFEGHSIELCVGQKSGGGATFRELVTNSIHVLDAMRWLCGEVAEVVGWSTAEGEAGTGAAVSLRFDSGPLGSYVMSRGAGAWVERLELHGSGRTAIVDAPNRVALAAGGEETTFTPEVGRWYLDEAERWGFKAQVEHFFACVRGEREPHVPPRDALSSQALAERIRVLQATP